MLMPYASVQAPFQNPVKSVADAALEPKHRRAVVATKADERTTNFMRLAPFASGRNGAARATDATPGKGATGEFRQQHDRLTFVPAANDDGAALGDGKEVRLDRREIGLAHPDTCARQAAVLLRVLGNQFLRRLDLQQPL